MFLIFFLRKTSVVEGKTEWAVWLYHQCNRSLHWLIVDSLSFFASLQQNESAVWNWAKLKINV